MIDAKQAVQSAMQAMNELYQPEQIPQLTLEEVELSPEGNCWRVTLSFARPTRKSAIEAMTGQQGVPTYKVLEIDGQTAEVQAMRNRKL